MARGGEEALRALRSMERLGKWSRPAIGLEGALIIRRLAPHFFFTSTEAPGMGVTRQGYDGAVGWILSPSLGNLVLEGALLESVKEEADFHADLDAIDDYTSMQTDARVGFHGFDCYRVSAVKPAGAVVMFYFEADSGLIRGREAMQETAAGPLDAITVMEEYREVDGVLLATRITSIYPTQGIEQEMEFEEITLDTLERADFEIPAEIRSQLPGGGE